MRITKETTIRGRVFKVTQLPGMRGTLLFYRLSSVVIPALTRLGKGLELLDNPRALLNADAMQVLFALLPEMHSAATFLFEKLPEAEFERLIRELLESTTVKPLDGKPEQLLMPIFDDELAGEVSAILQLVGFALGVNYGNFMPGLVAKAQALRAAKAASRSPVSDTSIGVAGASSSVG